MQARKQLIVLPGWGGNDLLWQYHCKHLNDLVDTKIIVITNQDTVIGMANAVLEQAPEQFILVGHSLGGWVAQHIAIKCPERINKLILLGTWTGYSSLKLIKLFKTMLKRIEHGETYALLDELRPSLIHPNRQHDESLLQQIKKSQAKFPISGLINQTLVEINGGDTSAYLNKITCPTLIIYGRQDSFFTLAEHQTMAAKIPSAKLTIIEDCGHMIPVEQPQAVNALLRLWIQ